MSNLPANADRPRLLNPKPGELMDLVLSNEHLYDLAGITQEERGSLLREAFDMARKHLHARIRRVFCDKGALVYSRLLPDHLTQSRAIDHAKDLAGLSKKDVPKVEINVTVNPPPWMVSADIPPPPKDITSEDDHAEVWRGVALNVAERDGEGKP